MATTPPKEDAGLLSKVVKFVKNPTTNWADLDAAEADKENSYSKQMLKEMIERKRRNDFVRKREFDMLRKLRRNEALSGADAAGRPSFFQSSMPSKPDDRAMTIKKIDEIEAQMSMQWWKTKHAQGGGAGMPDSIRSSHFPNSSQMPSTGGQPLQTTSTQPLNTNIMPRPGAPVYPATEPMPLSTSRKPPPPPPPPPGRPAAGSGAAAQPLAGSQAALARAAMYQQTDHAASGFSTSKQFAIEVGEFAHDPEIEEAAIRFANGDEKGAETVLLEVLGPKGTRAGHDEVWMALFDLYRATGQQERFEDAAIDFANRFGRSSPPWFSIPEAVGRMSAPSGAPAGARPTGDWTSPSEFTVESLAALQALLKQAKQPWRLDWTRIEDVHSSALAPLADLFALWAGQSVQLRFIGAGQLEGLLKARTRSGDKGVETGWWRLRMEALRVMQRADEFELVALDYCVTYEVSPPSWESARCEYKAIQADGTLATGPTIIGEAFRDSQSSSVAGAYNDTQQPAFDAQLSDVATVELAGHVLGDATESLRTLEERMAGADIMVISCARLIRIDFAAAGTLLNWVTSRLNEGRQVQFTEAHRLVAAFFNVIGIGEHARVLLRGD